MLRAEPRPRAHRLRRSACLVLVLACGPALASAAVEGLTATPLVPRSGPRGATMFTPMPPAATGIVTENRYADPRMWGERYHEFGVGAIGTGIAIADYDGDGRPDIFVVSKTESCRLFRNLGGWKFEDVTEKAGVADHGAAAAEWKQGAAFVDVNNDGRPDLYVCRFNAPNLLYINQGDGTFKEEAAARGLAVRDASSMGAFCDYDRDGWIDVYLQTNLLDATAHPNGQPDYLFHNNGDGTFTDVTRAAGIAGETQGHSATWWDFDNDGWPDLYVANDFAPRDSLYRNNRDGTFTNVLARVVPHTPFSAMGADLGDVNNDGLIDLFVADMAGTTHQKDQRGMADARARGREDYETAGLTPEYLHNVLYLNTGTGRCLEAAYLAGLEATDWTWSPRFEDLDNDGRLDFFVTNGMNREQHNSDLLVRIMGSENPADRARLMRTSPVLAEANLAYRNLGDLEFENVGAAWGLDQKGVSFGSAFADLDGDGDLDVVFANYQAGVTVLRNDSDTGHRLVVALRGTVSNRFGIGATVRIETAAGVQVRTLVLARGYLSTSEPIAHFGLGEATRIERLVVSWPSGREQVFTDVAADQRLTITEPEGPAVRPKADEKRPTASPQFENISETTGFALAVREPVVDETTLQPLVPRRFNRCGPALAVGDLDGDGVEDMVVGGTPRDPARVLVTGGSGFTAKGLASEPDGAPVNDGPVLIFDADGDGANDVLVTKGGASLPVGAPQYQPRLYLNDGHGNLRPAPVDALPPLATSVGAVAAADSDHDGRLDVFVGGRVRPGEYPLPARSALLQNRGGRFEDVSDALAPGLKEAGLVTAAIWSDVDGDGWIDLLVALEWGGVHYWHNNAGRGFEDRSEAAGFAAAGTGWWTALASADFNGDGRPDFVAGNVGLNTPYRASAERPALLFYGDFTDDGGPLVVEGRYEEDRLYPTLTRRQLGAKVPAVFKKFPRNDLFARATLAEVLGEERLAQAQRWAATELRSGVFLSQPDGRYRFAPLPRIAQIAPLQGVVAGDFDGDGHADLYAVQNSYAPVYYVGHFDGGLSQLLCGDGRGGFTPVPVAESGLLVTGDAKALAVVDLDRDGWPDFLVTRNNDTTEAFRNRGKPGRHALRVEVHSGPGNLGAVGARIVLERADGTSSTAEVQAGSGYFSQSSAACFFGWRAGNAPTRVRVRWPAGGETEQSIPADVSSLVIESARR